MLIAFGFDKLRMLIALGFDDDEDDGAHNHHGEGDVHDDDVGCGSEDVD